MEHLNDGSTIEQACLQLIFGSSAQVTLSPCDGEVGHITLHLKYLSQFYDGHDRHRYGFDVFQGFPSHSASCPVIHLPGACSTRVHNDDDLHDDYDSMMIRNDELSACQFASKNSSAI